jgi:hypothetical protein
MLSKLPWPDKVKVWEMHYLQRTPIDQIRWEVKGDKPAPSWETVKQVVSEFPLLTPAQVTQLPDALQARWRELQSTRSGKGQEAPGEDLPIAAKELKSQLFLPAPETVRIDDFGGHGHHIIRFRQDIFKVVSKIGYNTGEFWVSKEDWRPSSEIPADLEINYIVSPFGTLELFCPVEEHPLFPKLLSKAAQEKFSIRKKEGGWYLIICRDIYRKIYTEARTRTFQSAWETVKIGPQPLTPNFADLIYLLAILHRRSPGQFPIPDKKLYQIKPRGLFVSELYLGLIHLANAPEPPPIPPPPSNIILNGYIDIHRDMIRSWSASPDITELVKLFESLREIEGAIKQELMTDHPAQQDSPLVR